MGVLQLAPHPPPVPHLPPIGPTHVCRSDTISHDAKEFVRHFQNFADVKKKRAHVKAHVKDVSAVCVCVCVPSLPLPSPSTVL